MAVGNRVRAVRIAAARRRGGDARARRVRAAPGDEARETATLSGAAAAVTVARRHGRRAVGVRPTSGHSGGLEQRPPTTSAPPRCRRDVISGHRRHVTGNTSARAVATLAVVGNAPAVSVGGARDWRCVTSSHTQTTSGVGRGATHVHPAGTPTVPLDKLRPVCSTRTELNSTQLVCNKSTQLYDAFIGHTRQRHDMGPISKISYDNLTITPKLRST